MQDVKTATSIPDADLRRTLQSLACAKYKILVKMPKGRDINDTDRFAFNAAFTSPMSRIKILTVTNKVETGDEAKETQDRVDEDRRLMTEVRLDIFGLASPSPELRVAGGVRSGG